MTTMKKMLIIGLFATTAPIAVLATEAIRIAAATTDFEAKKVMYTFAQELRKTNDVTDKKVAKWLESIAQTYGYLIDPVIVSVIESNKSNNDKVAHLLKIMLEEANERAKREKRYAQDNAKWQKEAAEQKAKYDAENKQAQIIKNIKNACAFGAGATFIALLMYWDVSVVNLRTAQIQEQSELMKQLVSVVGKVTNNIA